jgi:uncharacterized DUF497 family protein
MYFEWDEAKRKQNIEKHKIDFVDAVTIYDNFVYTFPSGHKDLDEKRFVSLGLMQGIEIALVFTLRNEKRRIISARRARIVEREKYHAEKTKNEN